MSYTMTDDVSRMIVLGNKEVFMKNFEPFPIEYTSFTTPKTATKKTEYYDSMGNLKAAEEKIEGANIKYGKVGQAYQTAVTNKTIANGYEHTMEAIKYDLFGVINSTKAKELARTMREAEETRAVLRFDNAFATNLADGVPLCSASKPLVNSGAFNSTLATASSILTPENHKTVIKQFANFKNHAGGKLKAYPTDGLTNIQNQMDVEEIYKSVNKSSEISNTKNVLPMIKWHYSTYLASTTAWFLWDSKFEHVIFQTFMGTEFGMDEDKISTKNMYINAIAMYETASLPNAGIVGNAGA